MTGANPIPAWQDGAACLEIGVELFYVDKGNSTRPAKAVCARCTVIDECLTYALEHDEAFGVWGGLTERERRRLKRTTRVVRRCPRCRTGVATGTGTTSRGMCNDCQVEAERRHQENARNTYHQREEAS